MAQHALAFCLAVGDSELGRVETEQLLKLAREICLTLVSQISRNFLYRKRCIFQLVGCNSQPFFLGIFSDSEPGMLLEQSCPMGSGNTQTQLLADAVQVPAQFTVDCVDKEL